MNIRHHPDELLLLEQTAGSLDPAMSLILATHLHFCGQCRTAVALNEHIGGLLLDAIEPVPLAGDALIKTLARLDRPASAGSARVSNDNTPPPLRAFLGRDLSDMRWRKMGPRLGYITLYREGSLSMRLLRGKPGAEVGQHTHRGMEYTLVLRGGFTDTTGQYSPGDFQALSNEAHHNPVADPGEDCINLSVTTAPLRFDGMAERIVARLLGF